MIILVIVIVIVIILVMIKIILTISGATDHSVFDQHAREFEAGFLEDMDALGVRPADVLTRITEYVPQVSG